MNIPIATSTATSIMGYVSGFMGDFSGYITLILGLLMSVFVLRFLIDVMIGTAGTRNFDSTAEGDRLHGGRGRRLSGANITRSYEVEGYSYDEARRKANELLDR